MTDESPHVGDIWELFCFLFEILGVFNIHFLHDSSGNGNALCEGFTGFLAAGALVLMVLWLVHENDKDAADPARFPTCVVIAKF